MISYETDLGTIHRLESGDSTAGVLALLHEPDVSFDTETTGLRVYAPDFRIRLAQFGNEDIAYVWRPQEFPELVRQVTTTVPVWMWSDFDVRGIDRVFGVKLEETCPFLKDGATLSRLTNPTAQHHLKQQASKRCNLEVEDARKVVEERALRYFWKDGEWHFVSEEDEAKTQAALRARAQDELKAERKAAKKAGTVVEDRLPDRVRRYMAETLGRRMTKEEVWAEIPDTDEVYVIYAGQDCLLTSRVCPVIQAEIVEFGLEEIASFEHGMLYHAACMKRKGWKLDRPYAEDALRDFTAEFEAGEKDLARFGFDPIEKSGLYWSATDAQLRRFEALGVRFTIPNDSETDFKLDKKVRAWIAETYPGLAAEMAIAISKTSEAKRSMDFITGFLDYADADDRVHAGLNPLGARTGRMSCSEPNLQNCTKEEERIRGCFLADPGESLVSIDFSGVEWRVAAGVTEDRNMKRVFASGGDIHAMVAMLVYGDEYKNADEKTQKKLRGKVKSVGLGRLYGGGVPTLARQAGITEAMAQRAVDAIDKLYPGIRALSRRMYDEIAGPTPIYIETGRRVVATSAHLALNYMCQGPARDLLAYAVARIFEAGYGDRLLMLVHDEAIFSVPKADAEAWAAKLKDLMECEFMGVKIEAEVDILGARWRK
jgi:hypothetical protein